MGKLWILRAYHNIKLARVEDILENEPNGKGNVSICQVKDDAAGSGQPGVGGWAPMEMRIGRTDGRTGGRMNGRTDGWTNGQADGRSGEMISRCAFLAPGSIRIFDS